MQAYEPRQGARFSVSSALMVLNRDDPLVMADACPSRRRRRRLQRPAPTCAMSAFGGDLPQRPGRLRPARGQRHGLAGARAARPTRPLQTRRTETQELHLQRLMPADALRIRGRHNAANALAALALCHADRLPAGADAVRPARTTRGEPHRVTTGGDVLDERRSTSMTARAPTSAPPWPRSKGLGHGAARWW
jgi:UDP-N-acetylmuramoylalanine--D-glutamate ligase